MDYSNEAYKCGYFYRICAENKIEKYNESAWYPDYYKTDEEGNPVAESEKDPQAVGSLLTPPLGLKASCGKYQDKIILTWDVASNSVSSYRIYRSLNSDGSGGSQVATVYGNTTTYPIPVAADQRGVNYYFTVMSVGSSGNESVSSSVAMGYALKPGAPGAVEEIRVTKGRGDSKGTVSLEWDEVSGATKYRLYRYTSADATLKQSGSDIPNASTSITVDDQLSLKPNVFYYYQVQAISEINSEEFAGAMSDTGDSSENPAEAFLLSPPQNVAVKKINGDISNNIIAFSAAIGSQDCIYNSPATIKKVENGKASWNSYVYVVYGSNTAD
ncbi:MAG: fibronectin type III domain-containing protein, partial [Treponema sp.]|nr:fibronectin type III domain-containing protein [Treponema sp.]